MLEPTLTVEAVKEIEDKLKSIETTKSIEIADLWQLTVELDDLIWTDMHLWQKVIEGYETQSVEVAVLVLEISIMLFKETAEVVAMLREQYQDELDKLAKALNKEYLGFMDKLKSDVKVAV